MKFPGALPDNLYKDPALIYENAEQKTCAGCVWVDDVKTAGGMIQRCGGGEKFGRRCRFYSEKKNGK